MYLTVWASTDVMCHLGKTEKAEELWQKHAGGLLSPPEGVERVGELGALVPHKVWVEGTDYKQSQMDVAVAGVG
eukprot:9346417-Pyramimonas_sp.AAC.1